MVQNTAIISFLCTNRRNTCAESELNPWKAESELNPWKASMWLAAEEKHTFNKNIPSVVNFNKEWFQ